MVGNAATGPGDVRLLIRPEIWDFMDGALIYEKPRYRYALRIDYTPDSPHFPKNVIVGENLFHPGREGVCNQVLPLRAKE